ncbi:MAG TPA: hypothetical protein VM864_07135 [Pyrinomonadaceae bacterium]|jgi:hypothetical protein|nr:hypothetical protein [Pyrinomonadaceae bacterium]
MRSRPLAGLVCLSLAILSAVAAGQDRARQQLVVPLAGAGFVGFRLETTFEGARAQGFNEIQAALLPQALLDDGNTIHRVVLDREGSPVFGYDLVVEPAAAERRFRVTARPLAADFERRLRARRNGAQASAPPIPTLARAADAQTLDDGDAVALDLLVNSQTGVRVVDVVKVAFERARLWQSAPRDFTLDSVQIALSDQRLLVNGEVSPAAREPRPVSGALVWFYVPGRGRFILSLVPREGYDFRKTAIIEDNRVSFDYQGDHYELVSSAPVVGTGGDWFAWVLFDQSYTPEINSAEEIKRGVEGRGETVGASPVRQALEGKTPQPPPRAGFGTKQAQDDAARAASARRVRFGAADRIENLLPKK